MRQITDLLPCHKSKISLEAQKFIKEHIELVPRILRYCRKLNVAEIKIYKYDNVANLNVFEYNKNNICESEDFNDYLQYNVCKKCNKEHYLWKNDFKQKGNML